MTNEHAEELVEMLLLAAHDYEVTFEGGRSYRDHLAAMKKRVIESLTETLDSKATRADERLACWKIAENERATAPVDKQAWLVAFDIANAIKMRDHQ